MVAGLLVGCLMLATAAILVGGGFTGTQLTLVSLPDRGHQSPPQRRPGVIESRLAHHRVPVTRPVQTTRPAADPAPTRGARKTAPATPTASATRPTGTPRPQASPSRGQSPAPSPYRTGIAPPQPALSEATMGRTPPPRSTPTGRSTPRKTKKPWPGRHPRLIDR